MVELIKFILENSQLSMYNFLSNIIIICIIGTILVNIISRFKPINIKKNDSDIKKESIKDDKIDNRDVYKMLIEAYDDVKNKGRNNSDNKS